MSESKTFEHRWYHKLTVVAAWALIFPFITAGIVWLTLFRFGDPRIAVAFSSIVAAFVAAGIALQHGHQAFRKYTLAEKGIEAKKTGLLSDPPNQFLEHLVPDGKQTCIFQPARWRSPWLRNLRAFNN